MPALTLRRTGALLTGTLAAAALATAAPASAQTAPAGPQVALSGGTTTLKLDAGLAKSLKKLGVKASGTTFPITGGTIDPTTGLGSYTHSGSLKLTAGKKKVTLSSPAVTTGPGSSFAVKVGGKSVKAFTVSGGTASRPSLLASTLSGVSVKLSSTGAAALNKAFGVKALKSGAKVGALTLAAQTKQVAVANGVTHFAIDPQTAAALAQLNIQVSVVAPGAFVSPTQIDFPITGGTLDPATFAGKITQAGGLTLSKGDRALTFTDFNADTATKKLSASIGALQAEVLDLDFTNATLTPSADGKSFSYANIVLKLTEAAANASNAAFNTTAFTAGTVFGTGAFDATLA